MVATGDPSLEPASGACRLRLAMLALPVPPDLVAMGNPAHAASMARSAVVESAGTAAVKAAVTEPVARSAELVCSGTKCIHSLTCRAHSSASLTSTALQRVA